MLTLNIPLKLSLSTKTGRISTKDTVKIQHISRIEPTIGFTELNTLQKYRTSFVISKLGRLYTLFPFSSLALKLNLKTYGMTREATFLPPEKLPEWY